MICLLAAELLSTLSLVSCWVWLPAGMRCEWELGGVLLVYQVLFFINCLGRLRRSKILLLQQVT